MQGRSNCLTSLLHGILLLGELVSLFLETSTYAKLSRVFAH